jgi:hypothetical protein
MRVLTRIAAGVMTGFLISTTYAAVFADSGDVQNAQRETSDVTAACGPLSWEAANKLPWFIKASLVECMSPTQDDLQARTQERSAAYPAGHYVEAINHFRTAAPSAKP